MPVRQMPVRWPPSTGFVGIAVLIGLLWAVYIQRDVVHFDIDVFLRAGAAVGDGRDPYPQPGTPEVYSGFAYVYPYLVVFPFVPLAAMGSPADEVFIAGSVAAVLAGTWLAGARRPRTFALVLAASCTITGLQMGTLNALLFLGLVALWRVRDTPAAGVVAALLVYSKLFLAPVLLFLLLTRRWAASAAAVGALGLLFGVGDLTSPVGTRTYTGMLSVLAREEAPDGLSFTGLLMNVGVGLDVASRLAWVAGLGLVAVCWWSVRRGHREELLFAGTVVAALVASPVMWSHYLLLVTAPLLVVAQAAAAAPGTPTVAPNRSIPDSALAAFTVGSWLLVTPHLSRTIDVAGAGVLLAVLAGPPMASAAARLVRSSGGRAQALRAGVAPITVGVAAGGTCLALQAVAVSPTAAARVVGAYWSLLGVLAFLVWAWAHTGGRSGSRAPA